MKSPSVESTGERSISLTAVFHACQEGGFVGECLEIPGCMSQGDTQAEVEANLKEAINDCLSVMFEDALKEAMCNRNLGSVDFAGVSKQETMEIRAPHILPVAV